MADDATQRILRLAAYLADRRTTPVSLGTLTADVPGYDADAPRDERGELVAGTRGWETARKRVQRDLDVLDRTLGIEVESGPDGYRLRPPFFTAAERRALIAAAAAVDVEGVDEEPALGGLGTAVDARTQRIVLSVPARVRDLSDAIRRRAPVRFRYHGRTRTVDAYALGRWRTHWYVVGREHDSDSVRKYRLDRIEDTDDDAAVHSGTAAAYEIPPDFDAVEALRLDPNDWGRDPEVVARLRVDRDHAHTVQYELGGRVVERDAETVVVEVIVRHYESFRERVLRFSDRVHVLDPPELVTMVRDHLRAIVERSH